MSNNGFKLGFQDIADTLSTAVTVKGKIPAWLRGVYLRNGAGKYHFAKQTANHWFDGLSLISKFKFTETGVSYQSKLLQTEEMCHVKQAGVFRCGQFATNPKQNLFKKFLNIWRVQKISDNTAVNIIPIGDAAVALTELSVVNEIDIENLSIQDSYKLCTNVNYQLSTAHPHFDAKRQVLVNLSIEVGSKCQYHLFEVDLKTKESRVICSIPVKQPSFQHSFAMTENYIILLEAPLCLNPLKLLLASKNLGPTYIESYNWQANSGSQLYVINRHQGKVVQRFDYDDCFIFHFNNAYEYKGDVFIDAQVYPSPAIIESLYLKNIDAGIIPDVKLMRFHLDFKTKYCKATQLSDMTLEFGRYNYQQKNMQEYQFLYSAGWREEKEFFDCLVKTDFKTESDKIWGEEDCYPGEPLFIPDPSSDKEDQGVVISIVLDSKNEHSYLIILDAETWRELARVEVSHIIPYGLHGNFQFSA